MNTFIPSSGAVAIINSDRPEGHVAYVKAVNENYLTIEEANWGGPSQGERSGTPEQLKIIGYWLQGNQSISGNGQYQYMQNTSAPVNFSIAISQRGDKISGTIQEPRSTFGPSTYFLDSDIEGGVNGNQVWFTKKYQYDNNHRVEYSGTYDIVSRMIRGRWNIGGTSGDFKISVQ